jgi:hypothetical protein
MGQPIRKRDVLEQVVVEDLEEREVRVAYVLFDRVAAATLDVSDIAEIEIDRDGYRSGVENRYFG